MLRLANNGPVTALLLEATNSIRLSSRIVFRILQNDKRYVLCVMSVRHFDVQKVGWFGVYFGFGFIVCLKKEILMR